MTCVCGGVFAHFGSAAPATNDVNPANFICCGPPRSTHSPQIKPAPVDPHQHTHPTLFHHSGLSVSLTQSQAINSLIFPPVNSSFMDYYQLRTAFLWRSMGLCNLRFISTLNDSFLLHITSVIHFYQAEKVGVLIS